MGVIKGHTFAALMRIAKRKGETSTKVFTASIEDINKALKGKPDTPPAKIRERLPPQYADLWDAFAHSDEELPPHRPRLDAKIDLQGEKELPWCPLYQMSRDELPIPAMAGNLNGLHDTPTRKMHRSTGNGATERANQEDQIFLRTKIALDQQDWAKWIPAAQIAINNRQQPRRHGVSPFFLAHGYNIAPVQVHNEASKSAEGSKIADVKAIKTKLQELTEWAQVVTADTQQSMERQANKHRTAAPMSRLGQEVWLKLKNMKLGRPNHKLDWLNAKYKVMKQIAPMVYELDVPKGIHPTFHVDLLRPAREDPWPGQNEDSDKTTPLFNEKGEEVWLVDEILCAYGKRKKRVVWIKWKGFETPTCEPIDNVIGDNLEALHTWEAKWGLITKYDGPKETYLTPTGRLKSKWRKKEVVEKDNDIAV
ncbi:retrovirus polyprotein [Ceratocystis lukuohia]|uniref:Retrovirus polyprotein n=1 Tax=Ceratocystis lukuohia TaxID=2019550 RepID=A0ABR4MGK4_9PEZI